MKLKFQLEVVLDRTEGKFATKEEMAEQIVSALEDANPESLEGENEGQYEVSEWNITEL